LLDSVFNIFFDFLYELIHFRLFQADALALQEIDYFTARFGALLWCQQKSYGCTGYRSAYYGTDYMNCFHISLTLYKVIICIIQWYNVTTLQKVLKGKHFFILPQPLSHFIPQKNLNFRLSILEYFLTSVIFTTFVSF